MSASRVVLFLLIMIYPTKSFASCLDAYDPDPKTGFVLGRFHSELGVETELMKKAGLTTRVSELTHEAVEREILRPALAAHPRRFFGVDALEHEFELRPRDMFDAGRSVKLSYSLFLGDHAVHEAVIVVELHALSHRLIRLHYQLGMPGEASEVVLTPDEALWRAKELAEMRVRRLLSLATRFTSGPHEGSPHHTRYQYDSRRQSWRLVHSLLVESSEYSEVHRYRLQVDATNGEFVSIGPASQPGDMP